MSNNFFIITGGPGSGKTTLIEALTKRGLLCVGEVARKIIQEEIALGGDALPGENIRQRIEKMLIRSIETHQEASKRCAEVTIFDRGALDYVGYAYRTNTPIAGYLHQEALSLPYNNKVFITPPWQEIYCNDKERKQSFEEAIEVYATLYQLYTDRGYEILQLPKADVEERVNYMLNEITISKTNHIH